MIACMDCKVVMRPKHIGVLFIEIINKTEPYKMWSGDVFECPDCEAQIILKLPTQSSIADRHDDDWAEKTQHVDLKIKDRL